MTARPLPPGHTRPADPSWLGTTLEACVRDVTIGRIAAHPNVTAAMVDEWRRMHGMPSTEPGSRDERVHPAYDHRHDPDGAPRAMRPGGWRCPHGQPVSAPSVTPDSDQVRDEIHDVLVRHIGYSPIRTSALRELLSGPVGRLIAERDRYAAQVQRVEALATEDATDYGAIDHIWRRRISRALAAPAAEDGER